MKTETKKYNKIPPLIIFVLLFIYAINDLQTSSVTGNAGGNRSVVYIVLISIISITCIYLMYNSLGYYFKLTGITGALICLTNWIILVDIYHEVNLWSMLIHVGLSVLWLFSYNFFTVYIQHNPKATSLIIKSIFIMMIIYSIATVYYFIDLFVLKGRIPVMNLAYNVIVLMPWLCLLKNKKIQTLGYFITGIIVLLSMKRGALIVFPVMVFLNLFTTGVIEKKGSKYLFKLIGFILFFGITLYITDAITNGFLSYRFSGEQMATGSGRDVLYAMAIDSIKNRNDFDFMFGLGSGSSVDALGTGVHNEWLEFLFSFGAVGAFLYALLYISILAGFKRIRRIAPMYLPACVMMIAYMLVVGLFGGIYFMHSTFYAFAFFGFVEGLANIQKRESYNTEVSVK